MHEQLQQTALAPTNSIFKVLSIADAALIFADSFVYQEETKIGHAVFFRGLLLAVAETRGANSGKSTSKANVRNLAQEISNNNHQSRNTKVEISENKKTPRTEESDGRLTWVKKLDEKFPQPRYNWRRTIIIILCGLLGSLVLAGLYALMTKKILPAFRWWVEEGHQFGRFYWTLCVIFLLNARPIKGRKQFIFNLRVAGYTISGILFVLITRIVRGSCQHIPHCDYFERILDAVFWVFNSAVFIIFQSLKFAVWLAG